MTVLSNFDFWLNNSFTKIVSKAGGDLTLSQEKGQMFSIRNLLLSPWSSRCDSAVNESD